MEPAFRPLDEYERIARNRPHPSIAKQYPKNTDGTLASIIQEQPKRIVQQVPTGVIESTDPRTWLPIVANYLLTEHIIPHATSQAEPLQKSWAAMQKGLTFGAQGSMTFFANHGDYFGGDFKLPFIKDMFFEPGKLTFKDCNYFFIRAWYQESDVDAIVQREQRLKRNATKRGEEYQSGWDTAVLKRAKAVIKKKKTSDKSGGEAERNLDTGGIEIVHAFQNGIGAEFYSFVPDLDCEVCRTKLNKDPRGVMPVQFLYANIDLSNPLGRGTIELSGGMQNFIDSTLQTYQYMTGLMMNLPLKKWGNVIDSTLKYKMNAVWDMGADRVNNDVEVVNINTAALSNFPNVYGLAKSQIQNLNNSADTSVSSEVGNPGFSKTDAGVEALSARLGVSDNYMRKQYEQWWSDVLESMVNLHFAEKSGTETLTLDADTAQKVRELDPTLVNDLNQFEIDYDAINDTVFKFEVDASSSHMKNDEVQLEALDGLLSRIESSPLLQQTIPPEKVIGVWNAIVQASSVESPEKISINIDEWKQQQAGQAQIDPATGQPVPAINPATGQPATAPVAGEVLPQGQGAPAAATQATEITPDGQLSDEEIASLTPEELQMIDQLQAREVANKVIEQAIIMLRQGMSMEDVTGVVMQSMVEEAA